MPLAQRGPLPTRDSASDFVIIESCAVLGGAATSSQCDRYGSQLQNCRTMCVGCASPRRRCIACVEQGFLDESAFVARGKKFCQFHLDNSPATVRGAAPEKHSAIVGFTPSPPPPPSSKPPSGSGRKERSIDTEKLDALAAQVTQKQIDNMAFVVPRMHPTKIRLLEGVALGKKGSELADHARLDEKSLTGKQTETNRILGISNLPQVQDLNSFERSYVYRIVGKRVYEAYEASKD